MATKKFSTKKFDSIIIFPPYNLRCLISPYPAPLFLSNYIKQCGFSSKAVDFNYISFLSLLKIEFIKQEINLSYRKRIKLEKLGHLSKEQLEFYYYHLENEAKTKLLLKNLPALKNRYNRKNIRLRAVDYNFILSPISKYLLYRERDLSFKSIYRDLFSSESQRFADITSKDILKVVSEAHPLLIGFSVPFGVQLLPSLILASTIKHSIKPVHICFGGPFITLLPPNYIKSLLQLGFIDSIVKYEGETPLVELINSIKKGQPLFNIDNLFTIKGKKLFFTKRSKCKISPIIHVKHTRISPKIESISKKSFISVLQSTGCYWGKCSFCDYSNLYRHQKYRYRVSKDVVDDMEYYFSRGWRNISLISPAIPPQHAREIADEILRRKLDINWTSFIRVDKNFDATTLKAIKESGYICNQIGMETANNRLLKLLNKGYDVATIKELFDKMLKIDFKISKLDVIVDIPTTNFAEALEVYYFCKRYKDLFYRIQIFNFQLSLSSQMGKCPQEYGIVINRNKKYFSFSDRANIVPFDDPHGMSLDEKKNILKLYSDLITEMRQEREYNDLFKKIMSCKHNRDLNGILFCFPGYEEFIAIKKKFAENGTKYSKSADQVIYNLKSKSHHLIPNEMAMLLQNFSGKKKTFTQICRIMSRVMPKNICVEEFARDFINLCCSKKLFIDIRLTKCLNPQEVPPTPW